MLVAFNYADPSKVTDADVIGAITSGVYTGMQALQTTYGTMGFFPKILIAPVLLAGRDGRDCAGSDGEQDSRDCAGRFAAGNLCGRCDNEPRSRRQQLCVLEQPDGSLLPAGNILRHGSRTDRSYAERFGNTANDAIQRERGRAILAVGRGSDRGQRPGAGILVVAVEHGDRRNARTRRSALRVDSRSVVRREQSERGGNRHRVQRVRHRASGVGQPQRRVPGSHHAGQLHLGPPHDGRNRGVGGTRDARSSSISRYRTR